MLRFLSRILLCAFIFFSISLCRLSKDLLCAEKKPNSLALFFLLLLFCLTNGFSLFKKLRHST